MREIPEMYKDDEMAKAIKLADEAGDLCCDLALDTGALIDFTSQSEEAWELYNMLGEAVDKLSGMVNEIGKMYCMLPYYKSMGMNEGELKEYTVDCLDSIQMYREEIGDMITQHTLIRAKEPTLRSEKSMVCILMPENGQIENL